MKVQRATFEEVNNAQLELIFDHIERLRKEEETISPTSRKPYFNLLNKSLLGEGLTHDFIFNYQGNIYNLGKLSVFMRKMAYFTDTQDKKQEIFLKGKKVRVPIKYLWESLQENLYVPFDSALRVALKSSAELLTHERAGLEFEPTD